MILAALQALASRPNLIALALALAAAGAQTWRLHSAQTAEAQARASLADTQRRAAEDAQRAQAAAHQAEAAYRTIEQAWIKKHQEIANEAAAQTQALDAARAAGRIAGDGLRHRAQQLAASAAAHCPAPPDPAPTLSGPPAQHPATVLAHVLGRLEEAGRELAQIADARGVAGAACERAYDALNR